MTISLREAAERMVAATPEEWKAFKADLQHERANLIYEKERSQAIVDVLDVVLEKLEDNQQ